tara:strand:- start:461 stop:745 length:285 start_codon:yes stop_codon:yes gene_type:complete
MIGDSMVTVKDAVKKQFAPVTTETYQSWVEFRKERPVTAAVLTEMFDNPKKMFPLLKSGFTESDMVKLTPYTLYQKPKTRPFGRIVDARVSENR